MEIVISQEGSNVVVALEGRLDTVTSTDLLKRMEEVDMVNNNVVFDFSSLDYLSSAGLRALITIKNKLGQNDKKLIIRHCNPVVDEIFSVTGFSKLLFIEK